MIFRLFTFVLLFSACPLHGGESAQPTLPQATLRIGTRAIVAEIADDDSERAAGLMFRESLAPGAGMLFVMPQPGQVGFWMKNTQIPLSIAYLDSRGTIMEIYDLMPREEKIVKSAFAHIAYALEMSRGFFTKNNIWPGERVTGLPPLPMENAR